MASINSVFKAGHKALLSMTLVLANSTFPIQAAANTDNRAENTRVVSSATKTPSSVNVVAKVATPTAAEVSRLNYSQVPGCSFVKGYTIDPKNGPKTSDAEIKPWELTSKQCETLLPDIYYADPINNEQIAPLMVLNPTTNKDYMQIDRLIYPTIGAPNLFLTGTGDELISMANIEADKYSQLLAATLSSPAKEKAQKLALKRDANNGINFFLVKRDMRMFTENTDKMLVAYSGIYSIVPSESWLYAHPQESRLIGMRQRDKIKFIFSESNINHVPPGFYDIRMDVVVGGQLTASEFQYNAVKIFPSGYEPKASNILNVTDSQASLGLTEMLRDSNDKAASFKSQTMNRLAQFVKYLELLDKVGAVSEDLKPEEIEIMKTAFITFNGDLHNGGAPDLLAPDAVASNYNNEAREIIKVLKRLPFPIFLTIGNHDGYVATGKHPDVMSLFAKSITEVVKGPKYSVNGKFPQFISQGFTQEGLGIVVGATHVEPQVTLEMYENYLEALDGTEIKYQHHGGFPQNVFSGHYIVYNEKDSSNEIANTYGDAYDTVAFQYGGASAPNYYLYDGFNQWKKTYGPLNQSWEFGGVQYVNTNSYDLRTHMRSGWGMYTVNYGGNISPVQAHWVKREINRANALGRESMLLAHHDPRGGHKGLNYPFLVRQVPYAGIWGVAQNFVSAEVLMPFLCRQAKGIMSWLPQTTQLSCLQDGLQEWMRPDSMFDCKRSETYTIQDNINMLKHAEIYRDSLLTQLNERDLTPEQVQQDYDKTTEIVNTTIIPGTCDHFKIGPTTAHRVYSAYQMIDLLAKDNGLRTMLLGHTHYNSYENYKKGNDLIYNDDGIPPGVVLGDAQTQAKYLAQPENFIDSINPIRMYSRQDRESRQIVREKYQNTLGIKTAECNGQVEGPCAVIKLKDAGHEFTHELQKSDLMILRLTSVANLTDQKNKDVEETPNYGFSILKQGLPLQEGLTNNGIPSVNQILFFSNISDKTGTDNDFKLYSDTGVLSRNQYIRFRSDANPLKNLFDSSGAVPDASDYEIKESGSDSSGNWYDFLKFW